MRHPLDGCVAKVQRAEKNLKAIQDEMYSFLEHNPPRLVIEPDGTTGYQFIRLRIREKPPVLRWGVMVGEVVHQLRSALDHLIEQLTILAQGAPFSRGEFPVFLSPSGPQGFTYLKKGMPVRNSGFDRIRGLRPEHQAVIESMQPYHRWEDLPLHPLLLIHKLDVVEKHRVVPVVGAHVPNFSAGFPVLSPGQRVHIQSMHIDYLRGSVPLEDGANVGRFSLSLGPAGQQKMKMDLQYLTAITFQKGSIADAKPVAPLLRECLVSTVGIIDYFGPFFPEGPLDWTAPHLAPRVKQ